MHVIVVVVVVVVVVIFLRKIQAAVQHTLSVCPYSI
jgi:hypothetical protein